MVRKRKKATSPPAGEFDGSGRSAAQGAGDAISLFFDWLTGQLPLQSEALDHLRHAKLEVLKALKILLEKQISQLESKAGGPRPSRVQKVSIE